jgi:hypothetical protein
LFDKSSYGFSLSKLKIPIEIVNKQLTKKERKREREREKKKERKKQREREREKERKETYHYLKCCSEHACREDYNSKGFKTTFSSRILIRILHQTKT